MKEGGSMTACTYRIYGAVMNMMTDLPIKYYDSRGLPKFPAANRTVKLSRASGARFDSVCDRRARGAFLDLRQGRQARHSTTSYLSLLFNVISVDALTGPKVYETRAKRFHNTQRKGFTHYNA